MDCSQNNRVFYTTRLQRLCFKYAIKIRRLSNTVNQQAKNPLQNFHCIANRRGRADLPLNEHMPVARGQNAVVHDRFRKHAHTDRTQMCHGRKKTIPHE